MSASASDSVLRIVLEQPIHLSAQSRHGDFSFQTEFAHFPNLDLFTFSTKSLQHLQVARYLALDVGAKPWVYHACWYLLRAIAGCRLLMKTVGAVVVSKVIVLDVEAVSPRGQADRRVLTADVDAGLRLITCERSRFSQMAKQLSSWRSSTGRSPDSSHEQ